MSLDNIKVLLFDTFGTLADWRGSVTRRGERLAAEKSIDGVDWDAFARAWRAGYAPGMAKVKSGERSWTPIDVIHRERLDEIAIDFGIADALNEADRQAMNLWWHQLDPWPDTVPGLTRLKTKFLISPLSNGTLVLLSAMAKRAGMPWDFILSSETFKSYKREPAVYLGAIELLGLEPAEIMMTAAHNDDLEAARSHGMRTAYINRPYEYGADQTKDIQADEKWDIIGETTEDIATALGV